MASAARDMRDHGYQRGYMYDNLARQLDWEVRESELRHAGELRREEAKAAPKVVEQPRVLTREAQKVSLFSVVGFAAVAVMAVLVLFCQVQLTEISSQVVELKSQLTALDVDNAALTVQYQQMYDLSTVKEVAEAAGMAKPTASQIYYVDLSSGDSAVVHQKAEPGVLAKVAASISHGALAMVEYFD